MRQLFTTIVCLLAVGNICTTSAWATSSIGEQTLSEGMALASLGVNSNADSYTDINSDVTRDIDIMFRLGFNIGGTMPLGMPATIRSLNSYAPRANLVIGAEVNFGLSSRWGIETGVRFENKGMKIDANVKNYGMEMRKGTDVISGRFTGSVVTEVDEWMLTIPVMANLSVRKVNILAGPYISAVISGDFTGYAYDGYLREGDPTGLKIELGNEADTRGEYDFSDDLRTLQLGVMVGADWHFGKRLGAYLDLAWGLTEAFHSDFKTIEQSMYPIYASVGLTYNLK